MRELSCVLRGMCLCMYACPQFFLNMKILKIGDDRDNKHDLNDRDNRNDRDYRNDGDDSTQYEMLQCSQRCKVLKVLKY